MSPYLALLKLRSKALLQYRGAAFAGICTQLFWGWLEVMIFRAFYSESHAHQPMTLSQALTFVWLGQAFLRFLPWTIDSEIEQEIRKGTVAYALVRPLNLLGLWFARTFAMIITPTLMRCLPVILVAVFFFDFGSPISFEAGLYFAASISLAALLATAMATLITLTLFWTIAGEGIMRLTPALSLLLAGKAVPLPLFPSWMQPFLNWQPFRGIMDVPFRIYTGLIPYEKAPFYLLFQAGWIALFIAICHFTINRALKRCVIQGG